MREHEGTVEEVLVKIEIEPLEEGGYLATSKELQGLVAQGRTLAETMEISQDVARRLIESYLEHGDPLPPQVLASMHRGRRKTLAKIPVAITA